MGQQCWYSYALALPAPFDAISPLINLSRIELGAGSGLVGLALALASDSLSVLLTDLPKIVPLLQHNLSINPLRGKADIQVLNWGSPIPDLVIRYPEIILAADCCYLESSFPLLLTTMQNLMGPHTVCYFCFKKRRRADMNFIRKARKIFNVRTVDDDPDKGAWTREGIHMYVFPQDNI